MGIGSGTPNFHQVDVVTRPQHASTINLGPSSVSTTWNHLSKDLTICHEVGHLMGLQDEYSFSSGGQYINLNLQPSGQPQSIMAYTSGNVAVLQNHIDDILRILGHLNCP
ncbi:MAG: hypothetical protein FD167_2113 [bacterium]|nr:MAG: hypothetical protein FD167_2113 [bacterium]